MASYRRDLVRLLKENGCRYVRPGKGSHEWWRSPITNRKVSIPRKIDDKMLANSILEQAGITDLF